MVTGKAGQGKELTTMSRRERTLIKENALAEEGGVVGTTVNRGPKEIAQAGKTFRDTLRRE